MKFSRILPLVSATALLALATTSARAADLEVSTFDWSGFYGGLVAGYGWGNSQHCDDDGCSYDGPKIDSDGLLGGLELGYNHQFQKKLVLGAEIDYVLADMDGSSDSTPAYGCNTGCKTNIDGMGTARLRAGVALGRHLPYLTAGIAASDVYGQLRFGDDKTFWNFVAGGGVEYAATDRISVKVEYLHVFDNGKDFVFAPTTCTAPGCGLKNYSADLLRLGVNLHF